ncbi:multiple C2 and transmembrane domain-containing protein 1-like isoform X5 [Hydractinia symbiolongicarpus]|uniref:multiple C2 and transmembrane domain-containing protein 1-like isoform X5 n=1 Tax=Hydractinia symbiolongicarpus TaxID=13093 RepID=UPI002549E5A5|nr:multiple C2 and transmembrane domain-containing protein 1-like isoform X5 [Hydractinia symbiolongicarpus]
MTTLKTHKPDSLSIGSNNKSPGFGMDESVSYLVFSSTPTGRHFFDEHSASLPDILINSNQDENALVVKVDGTVSDDTFDERQFRDNLDVNEKEKEEEEEEYKMKEGTAENEINTSESDVESNNTRMEEKHTRLKKPKLSKFFKKRISWNNKDKNDNKLSVIRSKSEVDLSKYDKESNLSPRLGKNKYKMFGSTSDLHDVIDKMCDNEQNSNSPNSPAKEMKFFKGSLERSNKFYSDEKRGSMAELAQLLSSAKKVSRLGGSKGQIWDSLLSVILVKGKDLKAMDSTGFSDPYVRFKLGNDKYKSKVCKQTLSPAWHEQFDMKMFTGNGPMPTLEVTVWDKDSGKDEFMGRTSVDLSDLEAEKSHYLELGLEDQPATICLYVSITAQSLPGCSSDLQTYEEDPDKAQDIKSDYSLLNTAKSFKQIGWLQLKLHRAVGLAVADLGGASDPFAVIELGNQRLVTPTIYKTLNPQWDKIYELIVYDIHDVIEITVFDEDKRGAPEFLGRVRIPLLSITSWEKRLYQLKDKRLQCQAKGHLIMSLAVVYNPIRASIRTFNPKEDRILDETPRFRRQLLQQNVDRLTNLIRSIIATGEFIQSLFTWKYKLRSAFAFSIYILLVMNFDWFMLPLILFLVLLKNYIVFMLSPNRQNQDDEAQTVEDDDDDDDDDDKPKKGRAKTFREKLEAINNICMLVQNHMDNVASFGERIKNTFNWTIPFLSYLLMVILLLGTIVLYMVPLRYLLLAWGINKFTKRIRKPNAIPNNELLDFLSRIPSDPEVKRRRPFKADSVLR